MRSKSRLTFISVDFPRTLSTEKSRNSIHSHTGTAFVTDECPREEDTNSSRKSDIFIHYALTNAFDRVHSFRNKKLVTGERLPKAKQIPSENHTISLLHFESKTTIHKSLLEKGTTSKLKSHISAQV